MKSDNESLKVERENRGQPTRDHLDWVSKYLELADKVMENHKSQRHKDGEKH
jgi:hypothetical protein